MRRPHAELQQTWTKPKRKRYPGNPKEAPLTGDPESIARIEKLKARFAKQAADPIYGEFDFSPPGASSSSTGDVAAEALKSDVKYTDEVGSVGSYMAKLAEQAEC